MAALLCCSVSLLQGWAWTTTSITYTTTSGATATAPAGSVVAWGGGDVNNYNDVYVSTNSAVSWTLIGGVGVAGINSSVQTFTQSAAANSSFLQDDSGACKAYDPAMNLFYVLVSTAAQCSALIAHGLGCVSAHAACCCVAPSLSLSPGRAVRVEIKRCAALARCQHVRH
jgi:hypothetical protein